MPQPNDPNLASQRRRPFSPAPAWAPNTPPWSPGPHPVRPQTPARSRTPSRRNWPAPPPRSRTPIPVQQLPRWISVTPRAPVDPNLLHPLHIRIGPPVTETHHGVQVPKAMVSFPRLLDRPVPVIDDSRLMYLDARMRSRSLADFSVDVENDKLPMVYGLGCLSAIQDEVFTTSSSIVVPSSIDIALTKLTGMLPTHLVAVSDTTEKNVLVRYFPIHASVYASQCANFPLPPGSLEQPPPSPYFGANGQPFLRLPVILIKAHVPTFHLIQTALYTRSYREVLRDLVPRIPPSIEPTLGDVTSVAEAIGSDTPSGIEIVATCFNILSLWETVHRLCLYDEQLYETVDLAWAIALESVAWYQRNRQPNNPYA
ncbi:hypothetical protein DL93DRAFT_1471407 [Clavulina sp. PMI_390]|nr:hypothetical protein DL93DRAFT_1471407 [Clavulina sp. PMI_390]